MHIKKFTGFIIIVFMINILMACNADNSESNIINTTSSATALTDTASTKNTLTEATTTVSPLKKTSGKEAQLTSKDKFKYDGKTYHIIEVDGGDNSGVRLPNVAVDIGYGDRIYWALTNKYGQLIHVIADKVILQDVKTEPVTSEGRYYKDEANVPGTELPSLDQGHVIADSLGGVANAYNITPQDRTLNRHGDQAYMEKVIRDAGGCENFIATITYPDKNTQIPSHYRYQYKINNENIIDEFDNVNPDELNSKLTSEKNKSNNSDSTDETKQLSIIDTNDNGQVTIKEAKAAGYSLPITSSNWLYKYMDDRDGDGMVGE